MRPTPEEHTARIQLFSCVERLVKARFPRADVEPYGSATTGLTSLNSDLDICVSPNQDVNVKNALFQLASRLKNTGLANHEDVFVNHFAPIPIMIVTTRPDYGSVAIDIGINNVDGLQTRDLVKSYLEQMPALRPLILVFKRFLEQRELNNASKSGLGSYAATLMCINLLQTNPCQRPREVLDDPFKMRSLGTILFDFLNYYGSQYPHDDSVYMSISEGKVLESDSAETKKLRLDIRCPISGGNTAKSLGASFLKDMIRSFKLCSAAILQSGATDRNVLGPIVSVDQNMIDKRTCIHDFVHSGNLDELCNFVAQTTSRWQNYKSQSGSGAFVMPALLPFPGSVEKSDEQQQRCFPESSRHGDRSVLDGNGVNDTAKLPRKRKRRRRNTVTKPE